MRRLLFAAASLAVLAMPPATTKAEEASWGCQILLCAASQSPSWHGVPYCVPPMTKLIKAMAKPKFKWPICQEAETGKPGFEPFEACPDGMTAVSSSDGGLSFGFDNKDQCTKTVNQCLNRAAFRTQYGDSRENDRNGITIKKLEQGGKNSNECMVQVTQPRPRRADPYYFDIPNDQGVKQRNWFNLTY